jgi:hypothetical protein
MEFAGGWGVGTSVRCMRFVAMEAVLTSVSTCKVAGPHTTEGEAEQEAKFVNTSSTCMCMCMAHGA